MCYSSTSVALQPCGSLSLSVHRTRDLAGKTGQRSSACPAKHAFVCVCTEFTQARVCVFECAYLQPRIFVSPPRGVHALQVDHSGQLSMQGWPVVLCCVHERYAFGIPLPSSPWLSFRPFGGQTCQQNTRAAEGVKAARKVMLCEVMVVSV